MRRNKIANIDYVMIREETINYIKIVGGKLAQKTV